MAYPSAMWQYTWLSRKKSWQNANVRLPGNTIIDITKFRPTIVVEGAEEDFEEDFWAELAIGGTLKLVLTRNRVRCKSLNVDHTTGKKGEAGSIFKKLHKDRRVDSGSKWCWMFTQQNGVSAIAMKQTFTHKVGTLGTVLESNSIVATKIPNMDERSLPIKDELTHPLNILARLPQPSIA